MSVPATRPVVTGGAVGRSGLVELQRLAGNRAVGMLLAPRCGSDRPVVARPGSAPPLAGETVQRLTTAAVFDKKARSSGAQQKSLATIRARLAAYHAVKPKEDPTFQGRLRALGALDAAIHTWFSTHVTAAITDVENGTYLQALLGDSEREHRKVVAAIAKKPGLLPIDTTGLEAEERKELLQLWRSIVDGTGNLRIHAGITQGRFKDRMLAGVAKLLQTPAGQELLADVNAKQDDPSKRIEIGPSFVKQLKAIGKKDPADSQAVPKTKGDDVTSMAYAKVISEDVPKDATVADYTGSGDPVAFNRFLTNLPKGTRYFRFAGSTFRVGAGIGSYVKMAGKGEIHANVGTEGEEVLVPEYITLGHELGHSRRMLRGTTVPFTEDITNLGFAGSAAEQRLWNGAEEYVNILGVENQLRREHGMSERVYHSGDRALTQGPLIRTKLEELLTTKKLDDRYKGDLDALFEIYTQMSGRKNEEDKLRVLLAPETVALVKKLAAALAETASPLKVEPEGDLGSSSSSVDVGGSSSSSGGKGEEMPPKLDDLRAKKEKEESDTGSDEESASGGSGGVPSGTPYEVLVAASGLRAEVGIDPLGMGSGVSSPKDGALATKTKTGPKGSAHQFLSEGGYEATKRRLGDWLRRHGIEVVPNGGGGTNSCLIISLLQHATRSRDTPSAKLIWKYRAHLGGLGVGESQALLPTDPVFRSLLRAINADFNLDMKVVYVQAFAGEDPPYLLLESTSGSNPVVVWDKLGHYEALF